jgi:hypothetical protein
MPVPVAARLKVWVCGRSLAGIAGSPIPVAVRSKAWVFGRSLTGIVGSNPIGVMDVCVVFVVKTVVWNIGDMKDERI